MDETESEVVVTAGQRLREAREAQGLSIEDIAAQTRIPTRPHPLCIFVCVKHVNRGEFTSVRRQPHESCHAS